MFQSLTVELGAAPIQQAKLLVAVAGGHARKEKKGQQTMQTARRQEMLKTARYGQRQRSKPCACWAISA
jgi:hypothetical protein